MRLLSSRNASWKIELAQLSAKLAYLVVVAGYLLLRYQVLGFISKSSRRGH